MRDFSDNIDQANELAQRMNDHAVAEAMAKSKPEQVQNPDGSWPVTECDDCGSDIEPGRIELGKIRCITCQEALERANRWRR